jgi:DNA-binding transcriptional regulator YhcF (GntR family)
MVVTFHTFLAHVHSSIGLLGLYTRGHLFRRLTEIQSQPTTRRLRQPVAPRAYVSKATSELERRKIITKDRHDDGMYVDLNVDGIQDVRRAAAEREKTEELMESL